MCSYLASTCFTQVLHLVLSRHSILSLYTFLKIEPGSQSSSRDGAEVNRLQKQNAQLKEENNYLKYKIEVLLDMVRHIHLGMLSCIFIFFMQILSFTDLSQLSDACWEIKLKIKHVEFFSAMLLNKLHVHHMTHMEYLSYSLHLHI